VIIARYVGVPGTKNQLIGFTKADLAELMKSEVLLLVDGDQRTILVYAEDAATLEASVSLASSMLAAERAAQGEPENKC
jgi:hypothetical protein